MRKLKFFAALLTLALAFSSVAAPVTAEAASTAKSAKRVYSDVKHGKELRYVKFCYERGAFDGVRTRGKSTKAIKQGKFITYLANMYAPIIEGAHLMGVDLYGDTARKSASASTSDVIYDEAGKAYYFDSSIGYYRASDGTLYNNGSSYDDYYYDYYNYYYGNSYNNNSSSSRRSRSRNRRSAGDTASWEWAMSYGLIPNGSSMSAAARSDWAYEVCSRLAYYIDGYRLEFGNRKYRKMKEIDACRILYVLGTAYNGAYDPGSNRSSRSRGSRYNSSYYNDPLFNYY